MFAEARIDGFDELWLKKKGLHIDTVLGSSDCIDKVIANKFKMFFQMET